MLHVETTPKIDTERWTFTVDGAVKDTKVWTWRAMRTFPESTYFGPIHCVTGWSKFDMTFEGVSVDTLLEQAEPLPDATHAVATTHTGYTTNLRLDDLTGGRAWIVWRINGEPLPDIHGGPARLLIPHLYLWKSAKWVSGFRLLDHNRQGFWEERGYHDRGDPWQEQRYAGD